MSGFSWVTLATNDSYSLGALVLAHSLKRVGTAHELVVMVTPGVTHQMREKLRNVFDLVFEVNILDSQDERNLLLLQRPELGITFTKLHCWRLTQYERCVFLDADTLVLQNCDELFDREEFSAAPDVGWPDCFNSGVFVYKPSDETFNSLLSFALEHGSFDGGDQGLLNLYFSDWAHKDISKHLPFIYNMCSTACYSYLPAFKQFGENVKIIHFIGNSKPWLQYFNSENLQVSCNPGFEHLQLVFEHWWNLFCSHVHSGLQPSMGGLAGAFAQMTLREPRTSSQNALEDHLRKQGWESGRIDYLGQDSFNNVWKKICETMAAGPTKESSPPKQSSLEFAPAVIRVSPARQIPEPSLVSTDFAPATVTESVTATPAPISESDSAPALVRAVAPVAESVVTQIVAQSIAPESASTIVPEITPGSPATIPETAQVVSYPANIPEAALVKPTPATVSETDLTLTSPATIPESAEITSSPVTVAIASSPAITSETAKIASSLTTVPESVKVPSAENAGVVTSPAAIDESVAVLFSSPTIPDPATVTASPITVSDTAKVAKQDDQTTVHDSAFDSSSPKSESSSALATVRALTSKSTTTAAAVAPESIPSIPVTDQISDTVKEAFKSDSKAIESQKTSTKTEGNFSEKFMPSSEAKKEVSKAAEGPSESTPVPPPRKSGKNGSASGKKTTKKK